MATRVRSVFFFLLLLTCASFFRTSKEALLSTLNPSDLSFIAGSVSVVVQTIVMVDKDWFNFWISTAFLILLPCWLLLNWPSWTPRSCFYNMKRVCTTRFLSRSLSTSTKTKTAEFLLRISSCLLCLLHIVSFVSYFMLLSLISMWTTFLYKLLRVAKLWI